MACNDSASSCTPGQQETCGCPGGGEGVQVCKADGTFDACQCDAGGANQGAGGPGGTGTGTGGDGVGGDGQGGMQAQCAPAAIEDCYEGPSGTENVGPCVGGTRICQNDGTWGACMGQVLPAGEDCQTPADEDCDGATPACAAPWVIALGESSYVLKTATDPAGNIFILGTFDTTVVFGGGNVLTDVGVPDVFVAKLSSDGSPQWSFQLGDPVDAVEAFELPVDGSGNAYVTVGFGRNPTFLGQSIQAEGDRDIAVMKRLPNGNLDWLNTEYAEGLAIDNDGNLVIALYHQDTMYIGGPDLLNGAAFAVAKLAPDGSHIFNKNLFAQNGVYVGVTVDPVTNDILLAGGYNGTVDLGMGPVTSSIDGKLLLLRLAENGDVLDYRATGGVAQVDIAHILVFDNGDHLLAIKYYGGSLDIGQPSPTPQQGYSYDWVLARIDPAEQVTWLNHYYAPVLNSFTLNLQPIVMTSTEKLKIAGFSGGPFDLGGGQITDASFVLSVGSDGTYLAQDVYPNQSVFYTLALANDGVPLVGGVYYGTPTLAGMMLPQSNAGRGFIARLVP